MANEISTSDDRSTPAARPTIWGLDAIRLHDAYWRAHGVQCIRRNQTEPFQPGADLYLLLEPDQLVIFDLIALADRLAWRAALVTRLRVVDHHDDRYGEQLELDPAGAITCIRRRYRHRRQSAYRVLLTRKRRFARLWMQADLRREGWRRISRAAGLAHIDNRHCEGGCFTHGFPPEEARFLDQLVSTWRQPNLVIEGLHQVRDGVWLMQGEALNDDEIVLGPAWLGRNLEPTDHGCLIGPAWVGDVESRHSEPETLPLRLRDIRDIDPSDAVPNERPAARRSFLFSASKRTFDLVGSLLGLILASPVFLVVGVCIYLTDGFPIYYGGIRQQRGGKPFRCWKFRTMYRNADAIKHTLATQNAADGPQFFIENDPRVFRFGHFLRRYHLDELPQLWNVLLGQMSLVGPRPSPDDENQKCPAWREIRLSVKPGITGLWQLRRTREPGLDFQEWIRYDFEYVEKAGFWYDVKIFFSTFFVVIGKGLKDASNETR